jgi:outer membrane lipopolysaccharide assembly protein LptE/RlpB
MIRKNITLLFLIFILTSCGFSPIYQNNINLDFSIQNINFKGDRELNNFLKTNLNQYKNEKNINKIDIEVNSVYEKIVLSKSRTGDITNYQLKAEVIFLIKPLNKEIKIMEKRLMNIMDDKFEEARYERSIKQNFAQSIANKLSSELIIN